MESIDKTITGTLGLFVLGWFMVAGSVGEALAQQAQRTQPELELEPDMLRSYEQRVQQTYADVVGAVLKLYNYNDSTGQRRFTGSAVVVSPEGLVLTVAHVNVPGRVYLGRFPDGREVRVRGLGEINSLDAAMMQIEEKGTYPYVPIGRSANLQHGQPNISLGYAGSLQQDEPAPRLGFVVKREGDASQSGRRSRGRNGNRLQTTSLMEPGDSGGAVFDLSGRLIGLRSSINHSLDANYEIPIDHYLTYWNALLSGEEFRRPPDSLAEPLPPLEPEALRMASATVQPELFVPYSDTTTLLLQAIEKLDIPVFGIRSQSGDSTVVARGTLVAVSDFFSRRAMRGKSFLISKSSIVGPSPEVFEGVRKPVTANVLYRDEDRDLVLLEIPRQRGTQGFTLAQAPDSISQDMIGAFVHSPLGEKGAKMSVIGSTPFRIAGMSRFGYFGAQLEEREGNVVFSMIQDDSPAGRAELRVGMRLISLDNEFISSPGTFVDIVQRKRPGDTVRLEYLSGEAPQVKDIVLAGRPLVAGSHIAERFEGGKSVVRDGFDRVFTHDGRLHPSEMGSPLVDLRGQLYGINIARLSRTSTLALPVDEIEAFLRAAAADGSGG